MLRAFGLATAAIAVSATLVFAEDSQVCQRAIPLLVGQRNDAENRLVDAYVEKQIAEEKLGAAFAKIKDLEEKIIVLQTPAAPVEQK